MHLHNRYKKIWFSSRLCVENMHNVKNISAVEVKKFALLSYSKKANILQAHASQRGDHCQMLW